MNASRDLEGEAANDRFAAELILRIQAGEEDAFQQLYDLYGAAIYAYLRVALHDAGDAEDATQDVFVKALEALPDYRLSGAPFRVWLFRVARNHAINLNAKRNRSEPAEPGDIARRLDRAAAGELAAEATERPGTEALMALVTRLPEPQRQALVLHHVLGFKVAEVAEILERSPNAVRLLERRAISSLRERLDALDTGLGTPPERLHLLMRIRESPVARVRRLALDSG